MDTPELLRKDPEALGALLESERSRLRRTVQIRIDRRLLKRVDVSDVIQEVHLDAARRIGEYVDGPAMPFYLWLRLLTSQKLIDLHRHHLGAGKRDLRREVALAPFVEVTSVALAEQLAGSLST